MERRGQRQRLQEKDAFGADLSIHGAINECACSHFTNANYASLPQGKLNIWLTSIASGLGHTDRVDDAQLPGHVEYDYARYYRKA